MDIKQPMKIQLFRSDSGWVIEDSQGLLSLTSVTVDSIDNLTENRALDDLARIDDPILYEDQRGHAVGVALPACFNGDLFLSERDEQIIISTDFFEIAQECASVSFDQDEIAFMMEKGYCHPEKTVIREIGRFAGYSMYVFTVDGIKRTPLGFRDVPLSDDSEAYEEFKRRLNGVMDSYEERSSGHANVLLLSGGADSRLLFLLMKSRGMDFVTKTASYLPTTFTDNAEDVMAAERISELGGVGFQETKIDIDALHASYIDDVVRKIPCSPHFSFAFKAVLADIPENAIVWTGQNMDSLYNLGPTGRPDFSAPGISQWFKRFFLSRDFLESLPDVIGRSTIKNRLVAALGWLSYKSTHLEQKLSIPANSVDYMKRYDLQDDYLLLRSYGKIEPREEAISYSDIKREMYASKMAFLHGGDPQSISASAALAGGTVFYPYSHCSMIQWFQSKDLTLKDVWNPKRFVYKYIGELSNELGDGFASFAKPSDKAIKARFGKTCTIKEYEEMLANSPFGKECEAEGVRCRSVYQLPRLYWLKVIERTLDELGVEHNGFKVS